jgi:hypothetical protein
MWLYGMRNVDLAIQRNLAHRFQEMSAPRFGCDSQILINIYKIEAA